MDKKETLLFVTTIFSASTVAVKIIHPPLCRYICLLIFEERLNIKASY